MSVNLRVQGILADPQREEQIAILKGEKGNNILPIWITVAEGNAIRLGLEGIVPERPMSHELLESILNSLKLTLVDVELIQSSRAFVAKLYLQKDGKELVIDSVPGDAIALALRTHASITADEDLIEESGAKSLDEWLNNLSDRTGEDDYDA